MTPNENVSEISSSLFTVTAIPEGDGINNTLIRLFFKEDFGGPRLVFKFERNGYKAHILCVEGPLKCESGYLGFEYRGVLITNDPTDFFDAKRLVDIESKVGWSYGDLNYVLEEIGIK